MRPRLTGGTHFSERYERERRRYDSDGCFDSELRLICSLIMLTIIFGSILVVLVRSTCEDEQFLETTRPTKPGIFMKQKQLRSTRFWQWPDANAL